MVFKTLLVHSLFAKKSKCSFGQPKVEYPGHVITTEGVSTDPEKVQAMVNWPRPTIIRSLKGILRSYRLLQKICSLLWEYLQTII